MHSYIKVVNDQGQVIIQDEGEGNIFELIEGLQKELAQKDEVLEAFVSKLGSIELATRGFARKAEINSQVRQQQQLQQLQQQQQQAVNVQGEAPAPVEQPARPMKTAPVEQPVQPMPQEAPVATPQMPMPMSSMPTQQQNAEPTMFRRPPQGDGTVL